MSCYNQTDPTNDRWSLCDIFLDLASIYGPFRGRRMNETTDTSAQDLTIQNTIIIGGNGLEDVTNIQRSARLRRGLNLDGSRKSRKKARIRMKKARTISELTSVWWMCAFAMCENRPAFGAILVLRPEGLRTESREVSRVVFRKRAERRPERNAACENRKRLMCTDSVGHFWRFIYRVWVFWVFLGVGGSPFFIRYDSDKLIYIDECFFFNLYSKSEIVRTR